jgi:hypothetical protein
MTTAEQRLQEKLARFHDAVALKEPDRVPILSPGTNTFYAADAGFTMAETIYDYDKARLAMKHYLEHYDIDSGITFPSGLEGQGKILERADAKAVLWAGMPGGKVKDPDVHQFIEFELMNDGELGEMTQNLDYFTLFKYLPRAYGLLKPMEKIQPTQSFQMSMHALGLVPLGASLLDPEVQDMIVGLQEITATFGELIGKVGAWAQEQETEMGFPVMTGAPEVNSFDFYSDFLRGTMLASVDVYDDPELLDEWLTKYCDLQLERMKANPPQPGRIMFMPMHKGMDGFLSDEHYGRFYWPHLMRLITAWIDAGAIPYVYTEGSYETRMKYLEQLPVGKTIVHFEEGDPVQIKKQLKDVAAVSGLFPVSLLERGTTEQVAEEAKRLIDVLGDGGGYVFDIDGGIYDTAKRENWETLIETVQTYGKYR